MTALSLHFSSHFSCIRFFFCPFLSSSHWLKCDRDIKWTARMFSRHINSYIYLMTPNFSITCWAKSVPTNFESSSIFIMSVSTKAGQRQTNRTPLFTTSGCIYKQKSCWYITLITYNYVFKEKGRIFRKCCRITLDVKNCLSKANTRLMYKNKVLAGSFKSISKSIKWKC